MKKRMISMLLCGIMVWNFSGTAVESAGGKNFSSKGKFHGKKVEKHLRYEDLKGASKTKIDYAKKSCRTNGKNAANQINGLKNDRETFEIGVKEVLDEYYGEETLDFQKQEEYHTFVQEIDDAALEIVENYEEAAMERENAENSGRTSCATPQVTATVAMMLSLNVYLTPAEIEQKIKNRTDKEKNIAGFPRLDTGKAVSMTVYKP